MAPRSETEPQSFEEHLLSSLIFSFLSNGLLIFVCTELRPAELYFQMHLLASQSAAAAAAPQQKLVETMQSPGAWLLRAIHQNPSCPRYWKALQQLVYV
jgi:hypothetical protein